MEKKVKEVSNGRPKKVTEYRVKVTGFSFGTDKVILGNEVIKEGQYSAIQVKEWLKAGFIEEK